MARGGSTMTMNDGAARVAANVHPQPVAGTIGVQRPGRPGLGWLFLAPALVLLLIQQVIPALRTLVMSLREGTQLFGPEAAWVGLANYQFIAEEGFFWGRCSPSMDSLWASLWDCRLGAAAAPLVESGWRWRVWRWSSWPQWHR